MMRVVFVGFGAEQLSIELLSAILKREGHDVRLVFDASLFDDRFQMNVPWLARLFGDKDRVVDEAVALRPDVIAMSVLTNTYRWCVDTAQRIKEQTGAKVIFGGVHPSAVPQVVIEEECVDAVCVGEGDDAFRDYLRALESGKLDRPIPNLWFKAAGGEVVRGVQAGFVQDLDSLPFPDKALYQDEFAIRDLYMTITGRGCPYRCTFCFNNFWAKLPQRSGTKGGRYVRQRSVDHVIAELLEAKRRWNIRFVDFEDDVFTVDKRWIQTFLDRYRREVKVPWMCLTHPKYVDADIVRWMKEAGCTWVQIGIQSVDEHYKHTSMKRYETAGQVADAIDAFMRVGIGVKGDHIFGSPREPEANQEAAREFYATHTPARISTFWMTYYPGVEMTDDALRRGDITPEDVARFERGHVPYYHEHRTVTDAAALRRMAEYEALFRMMPAIPSWMRQRLRPEWFRPLPKAALDALSLTSDLLLGIAQRNPDHLLYGKYYALQILRHLTRAKGTTPAAIAAPTPVAPAPSRPRRPVVLPVYVP
jgi:anaerobic magnesium-protoporphyrin IX monomethyl ester cyclase